MQDSGQGVIRTTKIAGWFIAVTCMGVLCASFAESSRVYRYIIPEPPTPLLPDTPKVIGPLKYPLTDRQGDFVSDKETDPFYLKDPPAIKEDVEYDPATGMYVITERWVA